MTPEPNQAQAEKIEHIKKVWQESSRPFTGDESEILLDTIEQQARQIEELTAKLRESEAGNAAMRQAIQNGAYIASDKGLHVLANMLSESLVSYAGAAFIERLEKAEEDGKVAANQLQYLIKSNATNYDRAQAAEAKLAAIEATAQKVWDTIPSSFEGPHLEVHSRALNDLHKVITKPTEAKR